MAIALFLCGCQIKYKESIWLDPGQGCQIYYYEKGKLKEVTIVAPLWLAVPSIRETQDDGLIHSIEDIEKILRESGIHFNRIMTYDEFVNYLLGKSM